MSYAQAQCLTDWGDWRENMSLKHRGKGNFYSQWINRGKHLVDLNKEKQAHVSFFNFLFFRWMSVPRAVCCSCDVKADVIPVQDFQVSKHLKLFSRCEAAPDFILTLWNNGATCRSLRCNFSPIHRFVVTAAELYKGWLCSTSFALRSSNFDSICGLLPELLYMVSVLHVAVVSQNLNMI